MKYYRSISYATSNKDGEPELTIEYERTFFQWLFKKPATTHTFTGSYAEWRYFDLMEKII